MAWKHRTVAQELEIVRLSAFLPQSAIAKRVGLSKGVVLAVQRKYHVVLRFGRSYSSAQFRYAYDEHAWGRVIESLYHEQGKTLAEVAAVLGVDIDTVRRRMVTMGFRIRTPGESRQGRPRGPYKWTQDWPVCVSPGCTTRVAREGAEHCSQCTKSAQRRRGVGTS